MYRTVPKTAKYLGVAPKKVRQFVDAGDLDAIDLSSPESTRPRLGISEESIQAFEARRAVGPKAKPVRRRKATTVSGGKDFFAHIPG